MSDTSSHSRLSRRGALLAGLVTLSVGALQIGPAAAATPAEAWVAENVQKGLQILNKKQPAQARRDEFRTFLLNLIDIRNVALYTLGLGKRNSTPEQQEQFIEAFKDYANAVYEHYLLDYSGQTLKIIGSEPAVGGSTLVQTVLVDPKNASTHQEPFKVDFRVAQVNGNWQIKDAIVAGVDLVFLEQQDFDSFLGSHNMSVPALIQMLKGKTKELQR